MARVRICLTVLEETVEKIDLLKKVKSKPRGMIIDEVMAKQKEPKE